MEENDDADADSANFVPQIILMVILTLINAFFASAEMAVVSANKNKIKRLAKRKFYRYINPKFIHVNKYSQI